MSMLLRLCFSLVLLAPALVHAATLGNPGNGSFYSGVGVISGWKCTANGPLTVRFNGGDPISLAYGNARSDVRDAGACPSAQVGFVSIMNWGNLGDGVHTAVAYDNGVEFARSTFEVATTGEPFVTGAEGECRVPGFPAPGESMQFAWNQNTQHLEMVNHRGGGGEDAPGPRNVRVTEVGEDFIVIEWDPPTGGGAASYNVYYRSPNGPEDLLGNVNTTGTRVSGTVIPGECYRVTAVNAAGVEGEKSPEVCAQTQQPPDGGGGSGDPAALENPGNGSFYSGLGVISGWKCTANGQLTVRFNGGAPIPLAYGNARSDVRNAGACPSAHVGFVSIMNWANLGDGTHTAVVYDNGVEFARSTFEVATTGESFVRGARGECLVPDFSASGETMRFAWNQNTQHLEIVEADRTLGENRILIDMANQNIRRITRRLGGGRRDVVKIATNFYGSLNVIVSYNAQGQTVEDRDRREGSSPVSWLARSSEIYKCQGRSCKAQGLKRSGASKSKVRPSQGYKGGEYWLAADPQPGTYWILKFKCRGGGCAEEFEYLIESRRDLAARYNAGDPGVWHDTCSKTSGEADDPIPPCGNCTNVNVTKFGDGRLIRECVGPPHDDGGGSSGDNVGGGGSGGGGSGGGGLCGQNPHDVCTDIWTGDPRDGQSKAICQSACAYATQCHDEGVRINCANLRRLDELNNTNYGIRNCSVCQ